MYYIEMSKKIEKPRKSRKPNREKKPIKIFKKSIGSVQFWFYKLETEKPEPNPNRKKPEPNRSVWTGFDFFKIQFNYFFFLIKNESNKKWSPLILYHQIYTLF